MDSLAVLFRESPSTAPTAQHHPEPAGEQDEEDDADADEVAVTQGCGLREDWKAGIVAASGEWRV